MSIVDQIAAATGLSQLLNRPQAKQSGVVKETGESKSALVKTDSEGKVAPVYVKDAAQAGDVLSASSEAVKKIAANYAKALDTANTAMSTEPEARAPLAEQFNALLNQTRDFAESATAHGLNLVGSQSKPMVVDTTKDGGQITVAHAPSSAAESGISLLGKASWLDRQAIQTSVNQLQNAQITLSSTQAQFAQAQYTLGVAAELNRKAELTDYKFQAANASAVIAEAAHDEWQAEAKRTVSEEANREAALREAFGRQMIKE